MMANDTPVAAEAPQELLTADQVINALLIDADLRRAAATCVLPAVRFGSSWRFRKADLENWIRLHARQRAQAG